MVMTNIMIVAKLKKNRNKYHDDQNDIDNDKW